MTGQLHPESWTGVIYHGAAGWTSQTWDTGALNAQICCKCCIRDHCGSHEQGGRFSGSFCKLYHWCSQLQCALVCSSCCKDEHRMRKHLGYDNLEPNDPLYHTYDTLHRWGTRLRGVLTPCNSNTSWLMCTQLQDDREVHNCCRQSHLDNLWQSVQVAYTCCINNLADMQAYPFCKVHHGKKLGLCCGTAWLNQDFYSCPDSY